MSNMKTPAGTTRRIVVPETPWEELERLRAELLRNEDELASTKRVIDQLGAKKRRAPQAERTALATALREGRQPEPAEDLDRQLREAQRAYAARAQIRDTIAMEVAALVDDRREAWLAESAKEMAAVRTEIVAAVVLARAIVESKLEPLARRAYWLRWFPEVKPHARPPATKMRVAGSDVAAVEVLAAIESAFSPEGAARVF